MRIAHVVGKLKAGGVESVIFNYLRNMDRDGIDVDVLYDSDSDVAPPKVLAESGVRFIEIPPYQRLPKYLKEIKRLCRENGYDAVHSNINSLSGFPLFAAKRGGVKIRVAHNHTTSSKVEGKRDLAKRALRPLARRYATDYAACSEKAARWLFGDEAVERGEVRLFNNAIDVDRFRYSEESRAEVRAALGLSDEFVLLHVGRFVTTKNHPFIIEVFKELKAIVPDARLILVGDGEDAEAVRETIASEGLSDDVIMTGIVGDTEKYYSAADAFLLPSLYEGLPVVAVEAEAAGLPVFISDAVTRECAVTPHVTFLPLSAGARTWAEKISSCGRHDRAADGDIMKDSDFNISKSANDMRDYYFELVSGGSARRKK